MMFRKGKRFNFVKFVISLLVLIIICVLGYYIMGYNGLIYMKRVEGEKVYDFVEDIDADGKKENVKFLNHYCFYDKKYTSDAEYTLNYINIYLNDKKLYSNKITSLNALLNPKIIDLVEEDTVKKQVYVHDNGGGPAIPMDYFFYIEEGKVMFDCKKSNLYID